MTSTLATAAATWGVAMALAPLLQIRTILEHRSSKGVSVSYQYVLAIGFVLWLSYGIALHNVAIIIPNTVALAISLLTIVISLRFR